MKSGDNKRKRCASEATFLNNLKRGCSAYKARFIQCLRYNFVNATGKYIFIRIIRKN